MESSVRSTRVWVDGCFDLAHFGHANVIRQAKNLGDYLIVGIHSDAEITKHKGIPIFNQHERYTLLSAIKWVDEIVEDAPYCTQLDWLEKYNCDFCAHGDDISLTADGEDAYAIVKSAGRYREVKRTEGISTTDLIYRILLALQRVHSSLNSLTAGDSTCLTSPAPGHFSLKMSHNYARNCIYTSGLSSYLPNMVRISEFLSPAHLNSSHLKESIRPPNRDDVIIYAPGAFDLFHVGHVMFLLKCMELGTYIIIGLHSDETASIEAGRIGPILNIHERLLSLLACRYVDNVILDAPYIIDEGLLDLFKINYVVVGMDTQSVVINGNDPMKVPKERGIFRRIESGSKVTTRLVVDRIFKNRLIYEERNRTKEERETMELANFN